MRDLNRHVQRASRTVRAWPTYKALRRVERERDEARMVADQEYTARLHAEEELPIELADARALLREVAAAGVVFDDIRGRYVEVQIDRPTWDALRAYREAA